MKSDFRVALLEKNCTWIRQIGSSVLNTLDSIQRSRQVSGITCCGLMNVGLTCLGPTAKLWSSERPQKHDPKCIVPTVKHGGKNVKCWDCMSSSGVGNLSFLGRNMKREILPKKFSSICKKFEAELGIGHGT